MTRISLNRKAIQIIPILMVIMVLSGCTGRDQVMDGDGMFQIEENVTKERTTMNSEIDDMTPSAIPLIRVEDEFFSIDLEGNPSSEAFFEKLRSENIEVKMSDYGGFEKVGNLPWQLPTNDEEITTQPGDLILYQGNKIAVYYDENTRNFTRLGRINAEEEEIREVFGGDGDIAAEFFLEWTE